MIRCSILPIMLTKALLTFKPLCTLHFKVYALIPLENCQSAVGHRLQATRENDSLNNVLTCCVLTLFRILDLSVPERLALISFKFVP